MSKQRSSVNIAYQPAEGEKLTVSIIGGSSDEFTFEAMCETAVKAFTESLVTAITAYRENSPDATP